MAPLSVTTECEEEADTEAGFRTTSTTRCEASWRVPGFSAASIYRVVTMDTGLPTLHWRQLPGARRSRSRGRSTSDTCAQTVGNHIQGSTVGSHSG